MYLVIAKVTEASLPAVRKSSTVATPLNTYENNTYRMVQTTSEPRMPIGMSRFGFFASCAAVDTASNPMKAKKTTPAAPRMPIMPPSGGVMPSDVVYVVAAGMYGVWFAGFMNPHPMKMTSSTIATFVTTMMLLTVAD